MSMVDQGFEYKAITLLKGIYDNIGPAAPYTSIQGLFLQDGGPGFGPQYNILFNNSEYTVEVSTSQEGELRFSTTYGGSEDFVTILIGTSSDYRCALTYNIDSLGPLEFFVTSKDIATGNLTQSGLAYRTFFEIRFYQEP